MRIYQEIFVSLQQKETMGRIDSIGILIKLH
jgi:hypothetical protein